MNPEIRDIVGGIAAWQFQFWLGALGLLLPLWALKRWIFDP